MSTSPSIYWASSLAFGAKIRQGEVFSDLCQIKLNLPTLGTSALAVDIVRHSLAITLSQDCDLEQDHIVRQSSQLNDKLLPNVLFCEVATAQELRLRVAQNDKEWHNRLHIPKNKHERFQFLQKVDATEDALKIGLEEMGIDFKRCFSIPTDEIYRRIELGEAKRRCVLRSPYLEHFSSRFAYFLSRVALPSDHASDPAM